MKPSLAARAEPGDRTRSGGGRPRGPKRKIDAEAWFETALELMAVGGIDSVRVETLALKLGVTKGTFYVRFETRDQFVELLLDHWRRISTLVVIAELSAIDEPPLDRLVRVFSISTTERAKVRARIEASVRLWAYYDERPARVLREIDQHRLMYFESVVVANGVPKSEAEARAFLIYAFLISDAMLPGDRASIRDICRAFLAMGTKWPA